MSSLSRLWLCKRILDSVERPFARGASKIHHQQRKDHAAQTDIYRSHSLAHQRRSK